MTATATPEQAAEALRQFVTEQVRDQRLSAEALDLLLRQWARALLDLPTTGPLDPGAIRSAYRAQARHHHPDAGGDRHRFEQLAAARERLLLVEVT